MPPILKGTESTNNNLLSEHSDDQALIQAISASDERAFQILFERYYKMCLASALNVLKEQDQAKDIVQDLFFWVWKNREDLNIQSSLAGYLKRATVNRCLNLLKKEQKFGDQQDWDEPIHEQANPHELMEGAELQAFIAHALMQLPERCRLVFTLKRIEGYSVKEIAAQLEISPKTIENQITKALKHLRQELEPYLKKTKGPP